MRKLDPDVKEMSLKALRKEVMRLRTAFDKELESTGNQRCWINLLANQRNGRKIRPLELPKEVFLANCARYYERNQ